MKNQGRAERTLLTVHGEIKYCRTILIPVDQESKKLLIDQAGVTSVVPMDDALGVSRLPFKITSKMMSRIAKEAVRARSYKEASDIIMEHYHIEISPTQVEKVTDFIGWLVFKLELEEAERVKEKEGVKIDNRKRRKMQNDILYLMTDGAMIFIRDKDTDMVDAIAARKAEEARNEEKRKERMKMDSQSKRVLVEAEKKEKQQKVGQKQQKTQDKESAKVPKNGKRGKSLSENSGTSKKGGWTESKHAIAFNNKDIRYYTDPDDHGPNPTVIGHRIMSRDCIGYIGAASEFRHHFFALAERNEWDLCRQVVIISDGATWIRKMIEELFGKGNKRVTVILDLYHAKHNAGNFANHVKRGTKQKKQFADELCNLIEKGNIDKLLALLESYKDQKMPQGVINLYQYIENNKDHMKYPEYKKEGYFVGSGAMESANIYMMQDRMKLPGQKWNRLTGQGMLSLKSMYAARKWEEVERILHEYCYAQDKGDA